METDISTRAPKCPAAVREYRSGYLRRPPRRNPIIETTTTPTDSARTQHPSRLPGLLVAAASIGLSPATYHLLTALGYTDCKALLYSTLVSGAWAAGLAAVRRKRDGLAAFAFALTCSASPWPCTTATAA